MEFPPLATTDNRIKQAGELSSRRLGCREEDNLLGGLLSWLPLSRAQPVEAAKFESISQIVVKSSGTG